MLNIKKFIYVINDITNLLLKKDREDAKGKIKTLRTVLIILLVLLVISVILNIYLFLR